MAAIAVATSVARIEVRRKEAVGQLPASTHAVVGDLAVVCAIAGLVGARVFHIVDYSTQFVADPAAMIFSRAGFSIYGGLFFGVAAGIVALVLFGVLWALRSEKPRPAYLFSVYLLVAGFERLLVEKIRINLRHDWLGLGLTQAEVISILFVLAGLLGVLLTLRGRKLWRTLLALGVVTGLSACVPL